MMDELEVLLYGHPTLRKNCEAVDVFDDSLRDLVQQMGIAMQREQGIGLAAPQVGRQLRIILAEDRRAGGRDILSLINPEFLSMGEERDGYEEGCLSLPEIYANVQRPVRIKLRYQDLDGRERELEDDGLLSRVIQHEADHLVGKLFVDHLPTIRRKMLARKLKALSREAQRQIQAGL